MTDTEILSKVKAALKTVFDPEIECDIYELGLVYGIYTGDDKVVIEMTLTSPGCPVAEDLPVWVSEAVKDAGFEDVEVVLV